MIESVVIFFIHLGAALAVILATGYAVDRNRSAGHYILVFFLLTVAAWQFYHGLMVQGVLLKHPNLGLVHVPFLYASGPMLYFFSRFLTRDGFVFRARDGLHFIPSLLIALMLIPFYVKSAAEKRAFLENPIGLGSGNSAISAYSVMILLILAAVVAYIVLFWRSSRVVLEKRGLRLNRSTYLSLAIIALNYFVVIMYFAGFLFYHLLSLDRSFYDRLITAISLMVTVMVYLIFLMGRRYVNYFSQSQRDARRIRYARSRITGLDVEEIIGRLDDLMTREKIFCDEDLSLKRLADELAIAPHQLSQILNERLAKNFNTYINEYRVREAGQLLREEPERTISSIAYAVGFNTMSSFYNWFCKIQEASPVQYRQKTPGLPDPGEEE
mgnify:CR=1 FL=1